MNVVVKSIDYDPSCDTCVFYKALIAEGRDVLRDAAEKAFSQIVEIKLLKEKLNEQANNNDNRTTRD